MALLKYGTFSFQVNDPVFSISKTIIESEIGHRIGYKERWDIEGEFISTSGQAGVSTLINAFESAFAQNFKDIKFFLDDNSTLSSHYMLNRSSATGIKVKAISYPLSGNAEYVSSRKYRVTAEADFITSANEIVRWTESVAIRGGGPKFVIKTAEFGPPQKQIVAQQTPMRAVQQGSAIGYTRTPTPATPIWPQHLVTEESEIKRHTPTFAAGQNTGFLIEWTFVFWSPVPLTNPFPSGPR